MQEIISENINKKIGKTVFWGATGVAHEQN